MTFAPFVREMPAFLHNFILSFLDTEYCTHLAFACMEALSLCHKSVREAGRESRSIDGPKYASPAHQHKKDTLEGHCHSKEDGRELSNVCTAWYMQVLQPCVQFLSMCLFSTYFVFVFLAYHGAPIVFFWGKVYIPLIIAVHYMHVWSVHRFKHLLYEDWRLWTGFGS